MLHHPNLTSSVQIALFTLTRIERILAALGSRLLCRALAVVPVNRSKKKPLLGVRTIKSCNLGLQTAGALLSGAPSRRPLAPC